MTRHIRDILTLACAGKALSREQAAPLPDCLPEHFTSLVAAGGMAAALGGAPPFTCGIINAKSGRCGENCSFCPQSRHHHTDAPVYPLVDEETLRARARALADAGVTYMGVVTSGGALSERDFTAICRAAEHIVRDTPIKLCASIGFVSLEQARAMQQAGFASLHHNLESAESYYPHICTTHSYAKQIETVNNAKAAGLRVCCGGIFGLGESWEQRLELSATLQTLDVDAIPVNFLNPIPGTPLERQPRLPAQEALAVIALLRLMHPARDILVCGGRTPTLGSWENSLFFAGANGLMVGDYLTLKGKQLAADMDMLRVLGRIAHA